MGLLPRTCILKIYKQFLRPVISDASMAWSPDLADTHVEALQRVQDSALRFATGCTKSTPIAHLHDERRVFLIKDFLNM